MNEFIYSKDIICPLCEKKFSTMKVKNSKLRLIKRDTDFLNFYEGVNPYIYEINVCPACGFAFSDNFNEYIDKFKKEEFIKIVTRNWDGRNYNGERDIIKGLDTYKLALISAQTMNFRASIIAGILLKISWLYRMTNNTQEEKRFMKGAIQEYQSVYELEDPRMNKGLAPEMLVYLLGELNYRVGNYDDTVKWFNLGISKYSQDPNAKSQTINMMRERWLEVKEMKNKG